MRPGASVAHRGRHPGGRRRRTASPCAAGAARRRAGPHGVGRAARRRPLARASADGTQRGPGACRTCGASYPTASRSSGRGRVPPRCGARRRRPGPVRGLGQRVGRGPAPGSADAAVDALSRGLELWVGDPGDGLGDLPCTEPLRRSLEERRGRAEDRLAELLLATGRGRAIEHLERRRPHADRRAPVGAARQRARRGGPRNRRARRHQRAFPGAPARSASTGGPSCGRPGARCWPVATTQRPSPVDALETFVATAPVRARRPRPSRSAPRWQCSPQASSSVTGAAVKPSCTAGSRDVAPQERVTLVVADPGASKRPTSWPSSPTASDGRDRDALRPLAQRATLPYEAWGPVLSAAVHQLPNGLADACPPPCREPLATWCPRSRRLGATAPASARTRRPLPVLQAVTDLLDRVAELVPGRRGARRPPVATTSSVALTRAVPWAGACRRVRVVVAARPAGPRRPGLLADLAGTPACRAARPRRRAARELLARRGVDCTPRRRSGSPSSAPAARSSSQQFPLLRRGSSFLRRAPGVRASDRPPRWSTTSPGWRRTPSRPGAAALAGLDFFVGRWSR